MPAFEAALAAHRTEIDSIADSKAAPTFANTRLAMELAGKELERVSGVFWNLTGADTTTELQALERELSPKLSRHWTELSLNPKLFARIDAVYAVRATLGLDAESLRLLERSHASFVKNGARLNEPGKERLKIINEQLSVLGTQFGQNILKDEADYALVLDSAADLAGLPDWLIAAMARAATDRGHDGKHAVTLSRSIIEPFLTASTRRDLRETAFRAWTARGENAGPSDNRPLVAQMVALRAEKAKLLGYASFAAFKLDDQMAKGPDAVAELLDMVWPKAKKRAAEEEADLLQLARAEGFNGAIMPWDWRHYSERLRKARHDLDEDKIKPYFTLDAMIEASFDVATRLFGVTFIPRPDLKGYHPDVRCWEVKNADGSHVGLFLGDYFARASKRSGAWMSAYRTQGKFGGTRHPIIVNVCNFAKPADGHTALLSFDDARTLFHEFGHGLHGLLSDVTYPSQAGTAVARDFVELPSQLYEHWLSTSEVLSRFARHAQTGQIMPKELIDRLLAARNFNQGFATVEYTSSALIDLAFHRLEAPVNIDPMAFEAAELKRLGMPAAITMRHRTPHFAHVFSGDGYSAGYYSYLWSEVMDADAFDAFREADDVFATETAQKLKRFVYAAGNSRDPAEAYTLFRGRMPTPQALLEKRGLG